MKYWKNESAGTPVSSGTVCVLWEKVCGGYLGRSGRKPDHMHCSIASLKTLTVSKVFFCAVQHRSVFLTRPMEKYIFPPI